MIDGYAVVVLNDVKQPFIFVARIEELLVKWKQWRKEEEGHAANTGDMTVCIDELEELISSR